MLAQIDPETLPTVFPPARYATIGSFTNIFFPLLMIGGALLFLGMLLAGAYRIITAGGTAENYESGKKMIQYSIGGFILVAISYFIFRLIGFITDIQIF